MRKTRRATLAWLLLAGLVALFAFPSAGAGSAAPSAAAPSSAYTIHLKSRVFAPTAGLDPALAGVRREAAGAPVHALVQLFGPPTPALRADLAARGVTLLAYIPDQAWLATIAADADLHGLIGRELRWAGPLAAADKVAPDVRQAGVGPWARGAGGLARLVVTPFTDVTAAEAAVRRHGGSVSAAAAGRRQLEIELPDAALLALAAEDSVQWIEQAPPPQRELNDGVRANARVDGVQTSSLNLTGAGFTGAIWDSGAVGTHDDFGTRVTRVDTRAASDHATHVAGTMAGAGVRNALYRGVAYGARVLSYKWDNNLTDHIDAADRGARLSQNSWGYGSSSGCTPYGTYQWDAPDYDQIARGYLGSTSLAVPLLVNFAAGNEQDDSACDMPGYAGFMTIGPPATNKNGIAVGAINTNDSSMTTFSSWGPTLDGRIKPDVVAGGCQAGGDRGVTSTLPRNKYGTYCGTSMATPATSGVALLLMEQYQATYGAAPLPSAVKAVLTHTAHDLGQPGPDYRFGWGRVDAPDAATLIGSGTQVAEGALQPGSFAQYSVAVPAGSGPLKLTLAWSDKEGTPNAAVTLVNNLELVVTDPSGARHYPWKLYQNVPTAAATFCAAGSAPDGCTDDRNPIEQVYVASPAAGTWTVTVDGTGIQDTAPFPTQSFSLASSHPMSGGTGPANAAPEAAPASATTPEDSPVSVTLTGTDAETCELGFSVVSGPANGSVALNDNACTAGTDAVPHADTATAAYTPAADFSGADSFTYRVTDGNGTWAEAIVSVTVTAVNDAPVATDDTALVLDNTMVEIDVLVNDTDADADSLTVTNLPLSSASGGTLALNGNLVQYTPPAEWTGTDTFTYTAHDGQLYSNPATVTVVRVATGIVGWTSDDLETAAWSDSGNPNGKVSIRDYSFTPDYPPPHAITVTVNIAAWNATLSGRTLAAYLRVKGSDYLICSTPVTGPGQHTLSTLDCPDSPALSRYVDGATNTLRLTVGPLYKGESFSIDFVQVRLE